MNMEGPYRENGFDCDDTDMGFEPECDDVLPVAAMRPLSTRSTSSERYVMLGALKGNRRWRHI